MTIAVGGAQLSRGWFDVLDDWLKRDRSFFPEEVLPRGNAL